MRGQRLGIFWGAGHRGEGTGSASGVARWRGTWNDEGQRSAELRTCSRMASRSEAAVEAPGFNPVAERRLSRGPSGAEMLGSGIDKLAHVGRGKWKIFWIYSEARAYRVRVDVVTMRVEVGWVFDAAKGEALFPNRHFGFESEGEASFNELHGLFYGDVRRRRDEQMDVVGHESESVDGITASRAVVVHEA